MIEDRPVGSSDPMRGSRTIDRCTAWAAVLSVAAACAALFGAWYRPVWHDELYTLWLARMPLAELIGALRVDSGPPLHYLICHFLYAIVGWPEGSALGTFVVRLPSVAAIAIIPWALRRVHSPRGGTFPWASLLAVSWLPLLYFGTEARAYALLALANTLVWVRGRDWIARGGCWVICFAVAAAALPLLHYTGYVSLAALPLLGLFMTKPRRGALWLALGAASLPALAWLPVVLQAPEASMAWVETTTGPGRPGLASLQVAAPAGPYPALFEVARNPLPEWMSLGVLGVLLAGAAVGALRLAKIPRAGVFELSRAVRLTPGLAPVVAAAVLALAGTPVYFAGRTESQGWALASAAVAILLTGLPVIARWIIAGSYTVVGLMTIALWLGDLPSRPPASGVEVGVDLASVLEPGDRIVVAGIWQLELQHGLAVGSSGGKAPVSVETIPRSQAKHPGWLDRKALLSSDLMREARVLEGNARRAGQRVWLVWSPALPLERTLFPAFDGWRRTNIGRSPMIAVDLLSR